MSDCTYHLQLAAYHDGELPADLAADLERHLAFCRNCSAELAELGELSQVLARCRPDEILPIELVRIHRAIAGFQDRSVLRWVMGMAAVAASVLIISTAWLVDGPSSSQRLGQTASTPQSWEIIAATGRTQRPGAAATGVAEGNTTHWMVDSMGGRGVHEIP